MQRSAGKQLMTDLLKVRNREIAEENSRLYYKELKNQCEAVWGEAHLEP